MAVHYQTIHLLYWHERMQHVGYYSHGSLSGYVGPLSLYRMMGTEGGVFARAYTHECIGYALCEVGQKPFLHGVTASS